MRNENWNSFIKNCFNEFWCWRQNFKEFKDTGKINFRLNQLLLEGQPH